MRSLLLLFGLLTFSFICLSAQSVTLPPSGDNQQSVVVQYMGPLAFVKVRYNSPDVTGPDGKSRRGAIWGELVPWGLTDLGFGLGNPSPWRAGANQNTTITFSHDMEVQGKPIAAGTYGFHVIPQETGPWTLIFSRDNSSWGSYFYDASGDALRVEAEPAESDYDEWLTYEFTDRQPDQTTLSLQWEDLALPFTIRVPDMTSLYAENLKQELRGEKGFDHSNYRAAAAFLLQQGEQLDLALEWADRALSMPFVGQKNYQTLSTKAQILEKMGREQEAARLMAEAIAHPSAGAMEIHQYGRQLIAAGAHEKALEVFTLNHERHSGAWPTNFGMARIYSAMGKYDKAVTFARKAHAQAPDDANRQYLEGLITRLEAGEDIN